MSSGRHKNTGTRRMLRDSSGQVSMFEKSLEEEIKELGSTSPDSPVECLGMAFPSDDARRAYFLEKLREKLRDPEFRKTEGFPIAKDEDILAWSDPPYYTACPNPFVPDFIRQRRKGTNPNAPYRRQPFATDVSEGKEDPIYNAHSYHTKMPHKAIMRYILHYTDPSDIVLDAFCGTGMTGVAARLCGDKATIESLGYRVEADGTVYRQDEDENGKTTWEPFSKLGHRRAILNDLSPAATFIAYNYNRPVNVKLFEHEAKSMLNTVESELGWMYKTLYSDGKALGDINYVVWSDVFVCPQCANELVFWETAVDQDNGTVRSEFHCPSCSARLSKRALDHAFQTLHDDVLGTPIRQPKQVPVLCNYTYAGRTYSKTPDDWDTSLLRKIDTQWQSNWFPAVRMPEGDESRRNDPAGITHTHHFFTKRNRLVLARLLGESHSPLCTWLVTGAMPRASRQHQIAISRIGGPKAGEGGATAGHRRGTLYIPSNQVEFNPLLLVKERLKMALKAVRMPCAAADALILETASATQSRIGPDEVDYIFTDPPFGGNIWYSELNYIWESVLKVRTNTTHEAVTNATQKKGLAEYQDLMFTSFSQCYYVLKPGHWMTVAFHNSQNSVWSSIQEALQRSGFVIADVRILDKKIKTHTQRTAQGSVNQDLAITVYKPNDGLEGRFKLEAGTEPGVWDFLRAHMKQLPVFVAKRGHVEVIAEREQYLLFDRMVAFHVQHGVMVPMSASEFYAGLAQRFPARDGMYFLPEQAAEYDKKRLTASDVETPEFAPVDEFSAIRWLQNLLRNKPQTHQEIHPQFLRDIGGWQKHEKRLELRDLLEENFLRYDGDGEVPSQIHCYLSSNFKDLRNLTKDDSLLKSKAKDRWYVPDPGKAQDLEKLRERALLREFEEYRRSSQKKLKVFRVEAVRAGFKRAWQERNYATIIAVANKLPEDVLQEDPKLLMWYDQAQTRAEE